MPKRSWKQQKVKRYALPYPAYIADGVESRGYGGDGVDHYCAVEGGEEAGEVEGGDHGVKF